MPIADPETPRAGARGPSTSWQQNLRGASDPLRLLCKCAAHVRAQGGALLPSPHESYLVYQ